VVIPIKMTHVNNRMRKKRNPGPGGIIFTESIE
jgi:hypothetical protein